MRGQSSTLGAEGGGQGTAGSLCGGAGGSTPVLLGLQKLFCAQFFNAYISLHFKKKRKQVNSKHGPKEQGPGFQPLPCACPLGRQPCVRIKGGKRAQFHRASCTAAATANHHGGEHLGIPTTFCASPSRTSEP